MNDGPLGASDRIDGSLDQVLPGGSKNLGQIAFNMDWDIDSSGMQQLTCIQTSSGTSSFSISPLTNPKSVSLAAG